MSVLPRLLACCIEPVKGCERRIGNVIHAVVKVDVIQMQPAWLLHNMGRRKIPGLIVKCVGSFSSNRATTPCLPDRNTEAFPTQTGIP
jgi:hypothetical protein